MHKCMARLKRDLFVHYAQMKQRDILLVIIIGFLLVGGIYAAISAQRNAVTLSSGVVPLSGAFDSGSTNVPVSAS